MGTTKKDKRGQRGLGRLYKRDKSGKEYKATSKIPGIFWIEYSIETNDSAGNVKKKRVRERLTDKDGVPITTLKEAKAEQLRIRAPFISGDKVEHLKKIKADLSDAERELEQAVEEANPPLKIADTWNSYVAAPNRPDSGPRTLNDYSLYFAAFEAWLKENCPDAVYLRDISSETAAQYAASLTSAEKSPGTFNKHTGFLKLLCKVLEKPARITKNPFSEIKRRKLKTQSRRELTIEEVYRVLDTATGDLGMLLGFGTFTGLRLGDCCTLSWGEIDLVKRVIRRVPNKNANRDTAKPVLVGIPAPLYDRLQEIPPEQRTGYLLPEYAKRYQAISTRSEVTRQIQAHFEASGIQVHKAGTGKIIKDGKKINTGKRAVVEVGFHSLRHTYVSMHAEKGTPAALIQEIVGHSNPAMTRHYTHVNEEAARRAADALDIAASPIAIEMDPERAELAVLVETADIEQVRAALELLKK